MSVDGEIMKTFDTISKFDRLQIPTNIHVQLLLKAVLTINTPNISHESNTDMNTGIG